MYRATNLSVAIGGKPILNDIDLTAQAGEITAIVGPNGSGKSTLLKALSGDLPYQGQVSINDTDLKHLRPWQAASLRAVLPQATTLSFPFTVREIVALGTTSGRPGLPAEQLESLPELALARVDLAGFSSRFYQELSGGEQQRVQLARVLCQVWVPSLDGQPRFLLLDEPVSILDIRHQLAIMRIARDFAISGGGVVAVLHDLNLAAMFADKILMMKSGSVFAFGTPEDVLQDDLLNGLYDCDLRVGVTPADGRAFVLPQSASSRA
jgi:iron complex transport system ATP-binding protein